MERESIGLSDKYNFGVEIEFANANIKELNESFKRNCEKVIYVNDHKRADFDFHRDSCLDLDGSVSVNQGVNVYGGEVSTRILVDKKEDWEELSRICHIIKDNGGVASKYCSTHVNVDISKFRNNPEFFEALYKLILVYENEILLFLMGDKFLVRKTLYSYAKPMRINLLRNVDDVLFDYYADIIRDSGCFTPRDGVNACKCNGGLLEFRYPNATLDPNTIQNNVNFILKLIDSIARGEVDLDFLNYVIQVLKIDPMFLEDSLHITEDQESFDELNSTISTSREDYESFQKQYRNVIYSRYKKM